MSKYSGPQFNVFLVDGYNVIASLSETANIGKESITQPTNPFGAVSEQHSPVGLTKGTFVVGGGFFDPVADALHGALGQIVGIKRIVSAAIEGNIIGQKFVGAFGLYEQKYEVQDAKEGMTKANAVYLLSGEMDEGVIVQHLSTFAVDWSTEPGGVGAPDQPVDLLQDVNNRSVHILGNTATNPSIVHTAARHDLISGDIISISGVIGSTPTINGIRVATVIDATHFSVPVNVTVAGTEGEFVRTNSLNGGAGYLQVIAMGGITGFVGKILHSPDNITYTPLITFTNVTTAHSKERIAVTGTIHRYLAFSGDITGTGSITVFSGFGRL